VSDTPEVTDVPDPLLVLDGALWDLRRAWASPGSALRWEERLAVPKALTQAAVIEAVAAGSPDWGRQVTVGLVGTRLNVDDSTASRLVSAAVEIGFLRRGAPTTDRRRRLLTVTPKGRRFRNRARAARRGTLAELLQSWDETDVRALAELLSAFTAQLRADPRSRDHAIQGEDPG
jgi:DNA-binding MarR family transcriptional regulator